MKDTQLKSNIRNIYQFKAYIDLQKIIYHLMVLSYLKLLYRRALDLGELTASMPDANGYITIRGGAGLAAPGTPVVLFNRTKSITVTITAEEDGSFSGTIRADLGDKIEVHVKDLLDNVTILDPGMLQNPDGTAAVGPQGGTIHGPGGITAFIPEGSFDQFTAVQVTMLPDDALTDVTINPELKTAGVFKVDMGDVTSNKEIKISIPAPDWITPDHQILLVKVINIRGFDELTLSCPAILKDGQIISTSPPFDGVRDGGYYTFVSWIDKDKGTAFVLVDTWITQSLKYIMGDYDILIPAWLLNQEQIVVTIPVDRLYNINLQTLSGETVKTVTVQGPPARGQFADVIPFMTDDITAPAVFKDSIAGAADVLPTDNHISIEMSEQIAPSTVNKNTVHVTDSQGNIVEGDVYLAADRKTIIFVPRYGYKYGETYTMELNGVKDNGGNLIEPYTSTFSTFTPEVISTIAAPLAMSIDKFKNYAVVQGGCLGAITLLSTIWIFDVADPWNPVHINTTNNAEDPCNPVDSTTILGGYMHDVKAMTDVTIGGNTGDFVVTAGGRYTKESNLYTLNVTDPRNPDIAGSIYLSWGSDYGPPPPNVPYSNGEPYEVALLDTNAYVANYGIGIQAVDLTAVTPPQATAQANAIGGTIADRSYKAVSKMRNNILAIKNGALSILSPSLAPLGESSGMNFPWGVTGVEAFPVDLDNDGNLGTDEDNDGDPMTSKQEEFDLALILTSDGIVVIDVTSPQNPQKMDMIPIPTTKIEADRERRLAYSLTGGGLSIISLKDLRPNSDPLAMGLRDANGDSIDDRLLYTLTGASGMDMVLNDDGSLAYVADYSGSKMKVVNLGLPLSDEKARICPVDSDDCFCQTDELASSSVDLTLDEYNDDAVDLAVKVQGHRAEVTRRFYDNDWHFDHLRRLEPVYADEVIDYINADGVRYSKANTEGTVFIYFPDSNYEVERTISVTGSGYLWKDRSGNWRQYDTSGKFLSYGNSNNVKVSFIYDNDRLIGVSDNSGSQFLWYEYDADGRVSDVRDASSRRVAYTYTGGKLTKVTDVLGHETSYQYDVEGRLVHKNNAAGKSANITYNEDGLVTSVTSGDGTGKFFEDRGAYSRITFSSGRIKDVWIDSAGNRTREDINSVTDYTVTINGLTKIIKDAGGRQTTKEYDAQHNLITVTHPDGSVERFTYEPLFNKPLSSTDELGRITEYTYDTSGSMTKMVEAKGAADERVTEYTYDTLFNLVTVKVLGDAKTAEAVTGMTYDGSGNITSITDPEGGITNFTYDIMGNIVTKVDARGKSWGYEYNAMGWLTKTTDPLGNSKNLVYDAVGNKIQETDEEGKVKTFEYDMRNNLIKSTNAGNVTLFEYDADNNLTKRTDPDGKIVTFQYDLDGHLVKTTDGNGNQTSLEYDNSGSGCPVCSAGGDTDQPKKITFPTFTRTYTYDARNRKTVEQDDTFTTRFTYDTTGNLISVTDKESKNTTYAYDSLNRLIKETDPAGKVIEYTYDDRGNLISLKDPKNGVTQFAYDRNNRLVREIRPMGEQITYAYDSAGNLIQKTDAENRKIENTYDSAGKLITSNFKDAGGSVTKSVTYTYDSAGHLISYNDGVTSAQYAYDNAYRITSGTVNYGTFSKTYSYTYNANSSKKSFTGPGGIVYQYTYDSNNQLTGIQIPGVGDVSYNSYTWTRPNGVTLPGGSTKAYAYDPLMRTQSITDKDPALAIKMDYQYTYDKMDNVLSKNTEHGNYGYQYDTSYRLTNAANPSSTEAYTYDAIGNRLTSASYNDWQYNGNNELTAYDGVTYQYDNNGNMIQKSDGAVVVKYVYDVENRMIRVEDGSSAIIATYYYDPFGRRLRKEVGGNRTYYFYSDEGLIGEYDNTGTEIKAYGYKPDSTWTTDPVFMKENGNYYFYHNDHLGTPMMMTDVSGTIVWTATYDSFGKADVQPSSTITNNLRFAGQYYDSETGLHYNWNRYYDPQAGRYITTDPIGFMGGDVNLYAYVGGNAVNFVDPWGLDSSEIRNNINRGYIENNLSGSAGDLLEQVRSLGNNILVIKAINEANEAICAKQATIEMSKMETIYILYGTVPIRFIGLTYPGDPNWLPIDVERQKISIEGTKGLPEINIHENLLQMYPIELQNQLKRLNK